MRDYDPTTGRYIQADPLGLVDGASVYGYALQNPGRHIDPRGETTWEGARSGRACNNSSSCIVIWSDFKGYRILRPGQCTQLYKNNDKGTKIDSTDYVGTADGWVKCRNTQTCYYKSKGTVSSWQHAIPYPKSWGGGGAIPLPFQIPNPWRPGHKWEPRKSPKEALDELIGDGNCIDCDRDY